MVVKDGNEMPALVNVQDEFSEGDVKAYTLSSVKPSKVQIKRPFKRVNDDELASLKKKFPKRHLASESKCCLFMLNLDDMDEEAANLAQDESAQETAQESAGEEFVDANELANEGKPLRWQSLTSDQGHEETETQQDPLQFQDNAEDQNVVEENEQQVEVEEENALNIVEEEENALPPEENLEMTAAGVPSSKFQHSAVILASSDLFQPNDLGNDAGFVDNEQTEHENSTPRL